MLLMYRCDAEWKLTDSTRHGKCQPSLPQEAHASSQLEHLYTVPVTKASAPYLL